MGAESRIQIDRLPAFPAAMNRDLALAYTGVSDEQLRAWEKDGAVKFVARGPRGQKLALKDHLDKALLELFSGPNVSEDFEFGEG